MDRISKARQLRRDQTKAEAIFWSVVQNRQFLGLKWKRQVPTDRFIADFVCEEEKLIVELDGGQHGDDDIRRYDQNRSVVLEQHGYRVIRFWNKDITENLDEALRLLQQCVGQTSSHESSNPGSTSPTGRGRGERQRTRG